MSVKFNRTYSLALMNTDAEKDLKKYLKINFHKEMEGFDAFLG